MKITADTNVLVRLFTADDPEQATLAADVLEQADVVAISLQSLCELVWVLERAYKTKRIDIAVAIRQLLATRNLVVNRPAVEAGLAVFEAGGDFADGIIAYDGSFLGGETFVSFDKKAVRILMEQGRSAQLLS